MEESTSCFDVVDIVGIAQPAFAAQFFGRFDTIGFEGFGFLVFGVTDYASKMLTPHYGAVVAKEPRSEESQAVCRLLGQRLAEWTSVFVHGRKDEHPAKKLSGRMRP